LLATLSLGPNEIDSYTGTGLINSDDNAYIEFQSPKQVGLSNDSTVDENEAALKAAYRNSLQYISSLDDPVAGSNLMADLSLNIVKSGDLDAAMGLAKQSVSMRETAHGYNVMGEIYLAKNMDQQALDCWNHALKLDPNHFTTLLNFTVYHLVRNDFSAARPWVDQALKIDSTSARAHHLKALTLEGTGNLGGAVDEFEIAAQNENYAETLARFYLEYGTALRNYGRYVESIQILEKYVRLQPDDYQGHYELAYAYQIVGDQQDNTSHLLAAENEYRKAIAISPDFAQAHYGLSNTLRRLGLPEQAQEEFKKYQSIREKNK
jgi:tetratricopeptide (TPR) repeat protein